MKKLLMGTLLISAAAYADVATVLPYYGQVNYDNAPEKSLKDTSKFGGVYTSVGNLGYLFEFAYNYFDTDYKDTVPASNLKQHDLTMVYSKYYPHYMIKGGLHYINNNEKVTFRDLGDGLVGIVGVAGYTIDSTSKTTYGLDIYYSRYSSAHNDTTKTYTTSVDLWQFTPYIEYGHTFSENVGNKVGLKVNMIRANDYKDDSYVSYELSDTLTYKNAYLTLSYMGGDMKSGVRDNGFSVYNTKDLYSDSYSAKLGYNMTKNLNASINYTVNDYQEFNAATLQLLPEGKNTIIYAALSYTF
jgi:hypothetical protein